MGLQTANDERVKFRRSRRCTAPGLHAHIEVVPCVNSWSRRRHLVVARLHGVLSGVVVTSKGHVSRNITARIEDV